jgi:hypothetical protein
MFYCSKQTMLAYVVVAKALWCYDTTLIFLEYEIVAMGCRSMNVDVAVMR